MDTRRHFARWVTWGVVLVLASLLLLLNFALGAAFHGLWPDAGPRRIQLAIGITALGSVAAFLVLARWGRARLLGRVLAGVEDTLTAGEWVLKKAVPKPAEPAALPAALDAWYDNLTRELRDGTLSHDYEIWRDLNLARDFQRAYLERPYPKVPAVHVEGRLRLEFAHRYEPTQELGGDFFDISTPDISCAGLFIADVMGHGTRSALVTAILRALIRELVRHGGNARFFLSEMNRLYNDLMKTMPDPMFASAYYLVLNTTAHMATFSSAGHPAPFFLHRNMGRISRLETPEPRGAALGVIPNETYSASQCRLNDKDVFLMFTDGVYEVHNAAGDEFGLARMEAVLRNLMYEDIHKMLDGLMQAIKDFAGNEPLADDICMIAAEVTTRPEPHPPAPHPA